MADVTSIACGFPPKHGARVAAEAEHNARPSLWDCHGYSHIVAYVLLPTKVCQLALESRVAAP